MPHQQALSSDSATTYDALHDRPHQQQQQQLQQQDPKQSLSENKAAATAANYLCDDSDDSLQLQVQKLLQEQGELLRKLSQGGSMSNMQVPLAVFKFPSSEISEIWSPCNTWVAIVMEQYTPRDQAGSTLWIWNRVTGATQEMEMVPRSHIPTVAWMPASSYLVWVKGHACDGDSNRAHKFAHQSFFSLEVASQQKHQLLDQPYQNSPISIQDRELKPATSASGGRLAYVGSNCVKLVSLPHLKDEATLTSPVHAKPSVAAINFNPAATHIAITWDGVRDAKNRLAPPFCLDVFATDSQSRCFSMP